MRKHNQTVLPLVMVRVGYEAKAQQAGKLKVCEGRVRVRGEGVGVAVTVVEGWDGESVRCYLVK